MTLSSTDWITISIYFAAVFAIGFYFSRKEKTSKDYFLAGRNVIWFAVGAYEMSAILCVLVLGWVFMPYYLKSNVFTMPEYLEKRFNPGCRWTLTMLSIFAYIFTKISVALFAGAILIKAVIGWPPMVSAVVLVIATGIYTVAGGFRRSYIRI